MYTQAIHISLSIYTYIYIYIIYIYIYIYVYPSLYIYVYIYTYIYNVGRPKMMKREGREKMCSAGVLKLSRKFPLDMTIPPLKIKILLESNPLKSRIFVRRLAVLSCCRHSFRESWITLSRAIPPTWHIIIHGINNLS